MDKEIRAVDVCSALAMSGNAGKYISIANGLIVESAPRIIMIKYRLWEWDINNVSQ
jgi:hypothetical protein